MAYHVQFLPPAAKGLKKLPRQTQRRIVIATADLSNDPRPPGCTKLTGHPHTYRIRVGNYRIVYAIDDHQRIVEVSIIAHRRDVYRDL